jgi:hypothetical protein
MSIDARLNKVMPGLTARERGILVLKSMKDKTPEDPSWRKSMPREQSQEFNRYISLMNACNMYLPLFITMVEGWTAQMELRVCWWVTTVQYGSAIWRLGAFVPAAKQMQAEQALEDYKPFVELPWERANSDRSWMQVADGMEETTRECVAHLWDDLMAIDTVIAEVAAQFGGEDPMKSVMRGVLEKARRTLRLLHEFLSGEDAVKVTGPREDALALARVYFDRDVELMEQI